MNATSVNNKSLNFTQLILGGLLMASSNIMVAISAGVGLG
ncbi:hypothetical protein FHX15_000925 [Rhizobium sp. BK650]|nr:hypothetical protein [Rhizobium sp. BK650]